jgi:pyruvate formate lyase activating enzyme
LVTAGYINEGPMRQLCEFVDAANFDLKALSDAFYRDVCDASLTPVLHSLAVSKETGVFVEVTNLVIPTLNDRDEDLINLCRWVVENLGKETPLHFSRFFPHHQMRNLPATPAETLDRAKQIAESEGLYHVYVGNIMRPDGSNTRCHACGHLLVARNRYMIHENQIDSGRCPECRTEVYGIWN